MNSSMKVTDVNMETEVPELVPNHVDSAGRHLPKHSPKSSMKIADVNMKVEALTNHINLRRGGDVGNKKTKKKIFRVPRDELDEILSYQAPPAPAWQNAAKRYPWIVAEMEKIKVRFLAGQEKMRRQYETLGYATFEAEVTDDEQEEGAAATTPYEEKDEASTTSFHEDNDDAAAVTTPYYKEKDEASTTSFHEENDNDAAAAAVEMTPYKEKDETSAASFYEENDGAAATTSPWIIPRGRGRRRFRPGVVKQACGVKKIT